MSSTAQAILKVNGNDVQVLDLETGADLLKCIAVEAVRFDVSLDNRSLQLELSPWAFNYDVAPADVVLTYRGERIKGFVIGDDVASRVVSADEFIREKIDNGKQED